MQEEHTAALRALCERAVADDGAEVIVLAGAPLAGLARTVRGELPVPVVDGVSSAVRHAETLLALAPGKALRGSFAAPPVRKIRGVVSSSAACRAINSRAEYGLVT